MLTRILTAFSEEALPMDAKLLLQAKGYHLIPCTTYAEAIGNILEDPPDLLITEKGFDGGKDHELIRAVKACLQKTNIPAILVLHKEPGNLDWQQYPVDDIMISPFPPELLALKIELAEARLLRVFDNNPLSRLPGNTSIIRAISRIIEIERPYAVCYVDIDNFKPYNDRYGFTQGDDIILMVGKVIVNAIEETARGDSFIGHVGGDDFVFIVDAAKAASICERILANFETVKTSFISRQDLEAGGYVEKDRLGRDTRFGLLSLSIAVVLTGPNKFSHYGEVSATASQLKHAVKKKEGSNYMIDRRSISHVRK